MHLSRTFHEPIPSPPLFQTLTNWRDSPLVAAARNGEVCILDGIDRVDTHCLLALGQLLGDGWVDLPSGERLRSAQGFRVIAISGVISNVEDARNRYISSDLGLSYHSLPTVDSEQIKEVVEMQLGPLEHPSDTMMLSALHALHQSSSPELKPSLRTTLRAFRVLKAMQTSEDSDEGGKDVSPKDVLGILENTFMVIPFSYMLTT